LVTDLSKSWTNGGDATHLDAQALRAAIAKFRTPTLATSLGQVASAFLPLVGLYGLMYASLKLGASYWITLALSVAAAAFIVRVFIIQHDCGHGSFFASPPANRILGRACSLVTLTPFENWRRQHAGHHLHWNDLDNRQSGADIYSTCLTVSEYHNLPPVKRLFYRLVWHPMVSLVLLPPLIFLLLYRIPFDTPREWTKARRSVHVTNGALIVLYGAMVAAFGWRDFLLVQLPATTLASIAGVWIFSLQHRFDGTVWARRDDWSPVPASLSGSSYLALPRLLQWFTGNIGFHHVHHLDPRIPNYRLQDCHRSNPVLSKVPTLTLWQGLTAMRHCLWDENKMSLVRFCDLEPSKLRLSR
jgi:omega-6 fatty acid desaturase (delta-12 desaturase)